jgi:hypothetical protein
MCTSEVVLILRLAQLVHTTLVGARGNIASAKSSPSNTNLWYNN